MQNEKVFYVPGQPWVIDFAVERNGVMVSQLQSRTLEQVQALNPGAVLTSFDDARSQIESGCKTEPRPINADDFNYALEVLPPESWIVGGDCESFKMSERTNGRVTAIYARIGQTFWTFQDVFTLQHAEIIDRIRAVISGTENACPA